MVGRPMRCLQAAVAPLRAASTVTPPAYNERVFGLPSLTPLEAPRATVGADPTWLAAREHEQEGEVRCSFALARSR